VGVFWDEHSADQLKTAEDAARALGVELQPLELRNSPYNLERAFGEVTQGGAGALLVLMSPLFFLERARIPDFIVKNQIRIPAMFGMREYAQGGGLMAYGASLNDMYRRVATYADKILKGAKPAELPVEQPTTFELVINLKTAKALGLTIPPSLLFQADEVLQ
jgi:putative tryptophan/tyrosine transport system substrate-binding protein